MDAADGFSEWIVLSKVVIEGRGMKSLRRRYAIFFAAALFFVTGAEGWGVNTCGTGYTPITPRMPRANSPCVFGEAAVTMPRYATVLYPFVQSTFCLSCSDQRKTICTANLPSNMTTPNEPTAVTNQAQSARFYFQYGCQ
jgi:hypothetical protein